MSASLVYVTTKNSDEAAHIGGTLLIAKTSTPPVDEMIERIRPLHSYQYPCVVSWKIDAGNNSCIDWIGRVTTQ
jgi:periplasmic divalent cation tolerance protein